MTTKTLMEGEYKAWTEGRLAGLKEAKAIIEKWYDFEMDDPSISVTQTLDRLIEGLK